MNLFIKRISYRFTLISTVLLTTLGCSSSEDTTEPLEETQTEVTTIELTSLPFGGETPTNILIRNQGQSTPDFLSLWLCGLPSDGAGNADASDWTNADGSWDYNRKPQVEGNVTWMSEFNVSLDGNGNRIITGNA